MKLTAAAAAAAVLVLPAVGLHAADDAALAHLPAVDELPAGVVQLSPVVPGMGEHWANPKDMPLGPIYCVIEGRVICAEVMVAQADLSAGRSFENLTFGLDGRMPPVDHLELNFEPDGHEGYEVPHYDVHMYFVPREVRMRLTGG